MISWLEKNKVVPWTITIFIFAFIFYISSLSFPQQLPGPPSITAAVYHISAFFLLAIFIFISALNRKWDSKKIVLSVFIAIVYAGLDELHQYFVPGRFTSFSDFLLDMNGMIFASLVYFILIEIKTRNHNFI
ncbi:MAG: VanZ family protein [Nanoarchaeota archaeon]